MIKTPEQILNIMKASAIGDMCFTHILGFIRPGKTEHQVSDEIERVLYALGAEGLSFSNNLRIRCQYDSTSWRAIGQSH